MWPIVTDGVAWSVGREPSKMAELIKLCTWAGTRKHVLDWVHIGAIWQI